MHERFGLRPANGAEPAPALQVERWFNTPRDLGLSDLRGRVVVLHAFQMLCPGCVAHGIPQAQMIHGNFPAEDVAVVGIHTVFEHHDAMRPVSLEAFLHEYRVTFPVAVDAPSESNVPKTMHAYGMRGTPTLILIDRVGRLRLHSFGRANDMIVGAALASLIAEESVECDTEGCSLP